MKSKHYKHRIICIIFCLNWHFFITSSMYSGSWCPYQVEKLVPCRVRNGTEPYYGPNICWKSVNGSYACTKKILYRPRYVTTYKPVVETKYKCCPGLEGAECQNECFNCSSYHAVLARLDKLEDNVLQQSSTGQDDNFYPSQSFDDLDVIHENYLPSEEHSLDNSLTFIALNTRITSLMSEFRGMESRIRSLEAEVFRLTSSLEDLTRAIEHPRGREHAISEQLTRNTVYPQHFSPASTASPSFTSGTSVSTNSGKRSEPIYVGNNKAFARHLEDNLERGDIASTLNDDYGEEVLFDNSTEQYVDPLHKDFSS